MSNNSNCDVLVLEKEFGEQTLSDRYKYLHDKMKFFLEVRGLSDDIYINENILHQVILDYFSDIYRLKSFQNIDRVNLKKIISYTVYWLLKRKVLQIKPDKSVEKYVFINESFITTFIVHEMLEPSDVDLAGENVADSFKAYVRHLNYHLKYRDIDAKSLELILHSFEIGTLFGGSKAVFEKSELKNENF